MYNIITMDYLHKSFFFDRMTIKKSSCSIITTYVLNDHTDHVELLGNGRMRM